MLTKGAAYVRDRRDRSLHPVTLKDTDFKFAPGGLDAFEKGYSWGCFDVQTGKQYAPIQYEAKDLEGLPILTPAGKPEMWPVLENYYTVAEECLMATPELKAELDAQIKTEKYRLEIIDRVKKATAIQLEAVLKALQE